MTVIVGIAQNGRVRLGSDSYIGDSDYHSHDRLADGKLRRVSRGVILGFAGDPGPVPVLLQVLRRAMTGRGRRTHRWLRDHLAIEAVIVAKAAELTWPLGDTGMLLGVSDRLYTMGPDLQPYLVADTQPCAIGAGRDLALGAMHASRADRGQAWYLRYAMHAAERYSPWVAGPFHFLST